MVNSSVDQHSAFPHQVVCKHTSNYQRKIEKKVAQSEVELFSSMKKNDYVISCSCSPENKSKNSQKISHRYHSACFFFFFLFPRLFLIIGILRLIGRKKNKAIFKSTIFLRDRHLPGLLYNLSVIREIHYHLLFRAKTLFTTFYDSVKIESPHCSANQT